MTSARGGRRGHRLRLRVGDKAAIAHRIVSDGEFEQSVEHETAAARIATIKTEDELVEITLEMRVIDSALMGTEVPPLEKGRNAVDAG